MTKHNFRIRESSCFYELTDTLSERGNKFVRFDDSLLVMKLIFGRNRKSIVTSNVQKTAEDNFSFFNFKKSTLSFQRNFPFV